MRKDERMRLVVHTAYTHTQLNEKGDYIPVRTGWYKIEKYTIGNYPEVPPRPNVKLLQWCECWESYVVDCYTPEQAQARKAHYTKLFGELKKLY